ncbi:hypothetical protein HHK36_015687 [Tetracentron sinense]|uniref:Protein SIEVE ELEMENT OCCLUSION B-like n=1 Tax=Tetracentron sinense TaxID=13715 RepID=A0A834Z9R6_TETSI|nr:hypothetical protein HHK36_015687 [Tetracentron sinense]
MALMPVNPSNKSMQQMIKGDRHVFSTSDDSVMLKQIQATHLPDGREVDVKPLLQLVEDVLHRAAPNIDAVVVHGTQAHMEALDDKTSYSGFSGMLEALSYTIHRISCEVIMKNQYLIHVQLRLYPTNHLAKSVALLKQLPDILEHRDMLKPRFDALNVLIKAMLDVTNCIIEFKELPAQYITPETPAMSTAMAHIPTAVYWTIRSVVACASQIIGLIGLGHEYITSTTESWELSSLAHKLSNIQGLLMKQLTICYQHIDEKKHIEAYNTLVRLYEVPHIDNMKILKALIYSRDDIQPLFDGSTKKRVFLLIPLLFFPSVCPSSAPVLVNIEVLRRKNVLLLISDIDISTEELAILEQLYRESRSHPTRPESQFEVVWIPIVDRLTTPWNDMKQVRFEEMQSTMPWYSVHHPSLIDQAVIKYIKEVWRFAKKPLLVVLDPQGRVVSPNALHMMWIWGSVAFPFTISREEALWKEEIWRLELLVDGIDQTILNWANDGRHICLYGGEDMEWIRKFTTTARSVAQAAKITLEMVYVGKSNPKERVKRNIAAILGEKLSYCWQDVTWMWWFWVRLESMWYSKMQHGKTVENDPIMQEIMTMLTFDSSNPGWAVISKGSTLMTKAKGDAILPCLTQYDLWKEHVETQGFPQALNDHLLKLHTPHHCNQLIIPGTTGNIPEKVVCSECGRLMDKYIMYRCCDD